MAAAGASDCPRIHAISQRTSNDSDGLVAEDGRRAIAHSAGGNALVPESILLAGPLELKPPRHCPSRDNDCVCEHFLLVRLHNKRALGQVNRVHRLAEDLGPKARRLVAKAGSELNAKDALGEAREVLRTPDTSNVA